MNIYLNAEYDNNFSLIWFLFEKKREREEKKEMDRFNLTHKI